VAAAPLRGIASQALRVTAVSKIDEIRRWKINIDALAKQLLTISFRCLKIVETFDQTKTESGSTLSRYPI
jgi:hypothetical protein